MINLDYLAARYGQEMAEAMDNRKDMEKASTTALDILNQQGVYALFLWLLEQKNEAVIPERRVIGERLASLFIDPLCPLQAAALYRPQHVLTSLDTVRNELTQNVKIMFFAKALINQTLIYARHRAKAN